MKDFLFVIVFTVALAACSGIDGEGLSSETQGNLASGVSEPVVPGPNTETPGVDNFVVPLPNDCSPPSQPTTEGNAFYVDPINGSMDNDGSAALPWKTFAEVIDNNLIETEDKNGAVKNAGAPVKGGDLVYLLDGNHGNVDLQGHFNTDEIAIVALEGHTPRIERIMMRGGKNWLFQGLKFLGTCDGAPWAGLLRMDTHDVQGPVSNIRIIRNEFRSTEDSTLWTVEDWNANVCYGIQNVNTADITITHNYLTNVNKAMVGISQGHYVACNTIYKFDHDAINAFTGFVIENNWISDAVLTNPEYHRDGIQMFACPCEDFVIRGNKLFRQTDLLQPIEFQTPFQAIAGTDGPFDGGLIENNVVNSSHWHGISFYDATNLLITNNTVYGGHEFEDIPLEWPANSRIGLFEQYGLSTNNIVQNNIANKFLIPEGNTMSTNLEITDPAPADFYFTDWQNRDFSLKAGSPAIDVGTAANSPTIDVDGTSRDANPDIGAYEFAETQ